MAIRSPINPQTIVRERQATMPAAMNFISGGSPLGSSIVSSAANKIVGFQRGSAAVAPRPPDLGSIIKTLSSNILTNVENRVQSINQNVNNIVNQSLRTFGQDYQDRIKQVDDAKPNGILANFLKLYQQAIGFIQFLGNRKNVKTLGDNLQVLQRIFTETFEVAKIIRQTIIKIVKQLSNLPTASAGGGGLNLDIKVPGGPLKRSAPKGMMNMLKMAGTGAAIAGGGALAVNALSGGFGGGEVQAVPSTGSEGLSGPILDRFNAILERFSAAIDSLSKKKSAPAPPPVSSGGGGGTQKKKDPPSSPSSPGAAPGKLSETATASPTAEGQVKAAGFDQADFKTFRDVIASKESGGRYDIQGGSGNSYSGRYQLGAAARQDAARFLGEKYQGDSDSARATFRKDPEMQERYFAAYTRANDSYLKGTPEYDALDKRGKLEVLAYAHNAGAGNAIKWLKSGRQGSFRDGNNTKSSDYSKEVKAAFGGAAPPKLQQAAVTVKPGVAAASTPAATQQQIAQTVSQPAQQKPQVTVLPMAMNAGTSTPPKPPSSGRSPTPNMTSGRMLPAVSSANHDNFLTLYSKMVYNIVD